MPSQEVKDYAWLHTALIFGMQMSKDPARRVGACIVTPDNRQVSFGYNGLVAGIDESKENWERPRKYLLVRHAELNAILNAPFNTRGCTLYSSLKPCHECLGDIVNAGIIRVVWLDNTLPYMNDNTEIWNLFAKRLETLEIEPNDITMSLYSSYNFTHDGYSRGE